MVTGRRILAVIYVTGVAALGVSAFSNPNQGFSAQEAAAMLLTIPAFVAALPVFYLGGAAIWSVAGADHGGPMWPVTLTYTVIFASTAIANVFCLRLIIKLTRDLLGARSTAITDQAPTATASH